MVKQYLSLAEMISGTSEGNKALVELITADCDKIGASFIPWESGSSAMTGGWKVALPIKPGKDYHWYVQDADGLWTHKQGGMEVIDTVGYYYDSKGNMQYNSTNLTDPETDAAKVGYSVFVGYYYIKY